MNIKLSTNAQLSIIECKNKLSKQAEQEQNHRYGEHWDGGQWGGTTGGMRER